MKRITNKQGHKNDRMKIKITGLGELQKKIEALKTPEKTQEIFLNSLCEKVPEAKAERHKFKFIKTAKGFQIDPTSISPELYSKIVKHYT